MKILSRNIAIAFSLLIIVGLVYYFSNIVTYVLIAWVLSMIGEPLMRFFQKYIRIGKYKAGPSISAILTILSFFIILITLILLFVPLIIEQANNLAEVDYSAIAKALEEPLNHFNDWLLKMGLREDGTSPVEQVQKTLTGWFKPGMIGNFFTSLFGIAGNLLFTLFSVVFITFFFLKEEGLFVSFLEAIVPTHYEQRVRNAVDGASKMLTRYFTGILIQISIITLFVSVLLTLLDVKNALLIGFFAGVINVIPYLGPMIGAAFGVFITISSNLDLEFYNEMLPLLLKVVAVFGAMQMLDNFLLQPFIFSNSVQAHPLEIFIVILIGAQLGGILGMILAIPVYTVLRVIARVFLSEFKLVQKITESIDLMEPKE